MRIIRGLNEAFGGPAQGQNILPENLVTEDRYTRHGYKKVDDLTALGPSLYIRYAETRKGKRQATKRRKLAKAEVERRRAAVTGSTAETTEPRTDGNEDGLDEDPDDSSDNASELTEFEAEDLDATVDDVD